MHLLGKTQKTQICVCAHANIPQFHHAEQFILPKKNQSTQTAFHKIQCFPKQGLVSLLWRDGKMKWQDEGGNRRRKRKASQNVFAKFQPFLGEGQDCHNQSQMGNHQDSANVSQFNCGDCNTLGKVSDRLRVRPHNSFKGAPHRTAEATSASPCSTSRHTGNCALWSFVVERPLRKGNDWNAEMTGESAVYGCRVDLLTFPHCSIDSKH